jgi:hypothetical protein
LFDEPPKGSKSLETFKISLTFRFVKLIKIRSHRKKFSNSDSVEQKKINVYRFIKNSINFYTPAFDAFSCFSGIFEVLKIFREFPMTKALHLKYLKKKSVNDIIDLILT